MSSNQTGSRQKEIKKKKKHNKKGPEHKKKFRWAEAETIDSGRL